MVTFSNYAAHAAFSADLTVVNCARTFGRRLVTLFSLTPCEYICHSNLVQQRLSINLSRQMLGSNT